MELTEAMRTTFACREFTDDPVSDEVLHRILDEARFAPSGGNRQGGHVVVVRDPAIRRRLGELAQPTLRVYAAQTAAGETPFNSVHPTAIDVEAALRTPTDMLPMFSHLDEVPVVLVVTVDLTQVVSVDKDLDRVGLDTGASIYPLVWNILLAARAEGLGVDLHRVCGGERGQEAGPVPVLVDLVVPGVAGRPAVGGGPVDLPSLPGDLAVGGVLETEEAGEEEVGAGLIDGHGARAGCVAESDARRADRGVEIHRRSGGGGIEVLAGIVAEADVTSGGGKLHDREAGAGTGDSAVDALLLGGLHIEDLAGGGLHNRSDRQHAVVAPVSVRVAPHVIGGGGSCNERAVQRQPLPVAGAAGAAEVGAEKGGVGHHEVAAILVEGDVGARAEAHGAEGGLILKLVTDTRESGICGRGGIGVAADPEVVPAVIELEELDAGRAADEVFYAGGVLVGASAVQTQDVAGGGRFHDGAARDHVLVGATAGPDVALRGAVFQIDRGASSRRFKGEAGIDLGALLTAAMIPPRAVEHEVFALAEDMVCGGGEVAGGQDIAVEQDSDVVSRIGRQVGGVLVASNCNFTGGGGQLGVKGQAGQYEHCCHWQGQHPGTQVFHLGEGGGLLVKGRGLTRVIQAVT